MKTQIRLLAALAISFGPSLAFGQQSPEAKSPKVSFSLNDVAGHPVALGDFRDKKAIVLVFRQLFWRRGPIPLATWPS